ncbi:MAG TPA: hypothetical protein VKA85_00995 [Candidatus Limnocylindrales bacterium]|nr:hypothetical protein [Candidatus Limnocylindrales bacterium]
MTDATTDDRDESRTERRREPFRTTRAADTRDDDRTYVDRGYADRSYADAPAVARGTSFVVPRDSVRWGPVVAGLVTALSVFLLLSLLALGLGVAAVNSTNSGNQTSTIGTAGTIVAAVIGILSFVIGGFVAGRSAAVGGRGAGALNGFLVWALGVTAILLLGAAGLGSLLGAAGDIFGQIQASNVNPGQVQVDPNQAADAVRNSALVATVSLAVPAIAAAIGGALGARREHEVGVAEV